jgi:pimeloyl-ACP methyl ester carboxylesterase
MDKIIILHGWTYSTDKWNLLVDLLEKRGFSVEIPTIPGLTENSDEIWDLDKYSVWLGNKIGNSKVILLGHSNGGRIASYFAASHPNNVDQLILIDCAGIYHRDLYIQIKRFVFGSVAKIGKTFTKSEILKRFLYKLAGESDYQKATVNMKKSMVNLISVDLKVTFNKITTDTLIIWGEKDKITPLSDALIINKLIKNSKLEIVKGARHSPFYTNAGEVATIVTEFLK